MRIALLGYGKMGKTIETIAKERGHSISFKIDSSNLHEWENVATENTDVVIEFTVPETALSNFDKCFAKGIPVIVGTTGWYDNLEEIRKKVLDNHYSFLWASNFSIGVNLFFELNKTLAKMMSPYAEYAPSLTETHHIHKLDAPSGTAITLADGIISNHEKFEKWKLDSQGEENELKVTALRVDEVPGTHQINYESENDEIEIKHIAKSRKGFALGSVIAAEWIIGKQGFFSISDVLKVKFS